MYGPQISPWTHTTTLMTQSRQRKKTKTNKKAIFFLCQTCVDSAVLLFHFHFHSTATTTTTCSEFIWEPKKKFLILSVLSIHVSPFFLMRNDQVYKSNSLWAVHRSFFSPLLFARTRGRHADSSDIQLGKEKKKNISNRVKGQQPFRNGLLHHQTFFFLLYYSSSCS